jgi:hypothetical protein
MAEIIPRPLLMTLSLSNMILFYFTVSFFSFGGEFYEEAHISFHRTFILQPERIGSILL